VTPEDFFRDNELDPMAQSVLDRDLLVRLRSGSEEEIRLVLRTSRRVLDRVGLFLDLPFSDFRTFKTYWVANDGYGSWQARPDMLNGLFEPVHLELARREDGEITSTLARPVTSHPGTGWSRVDDEVNELRRHFQMARSEQDYRNVGNDCVAVLERLSEAAFDADRHLPDGEEIPPVAKTKLRFDMIINSSAGGSDNAEIRKVARAVVELAQAVKHRTTPSRSDAGIAADSVIQLVNILRRLTEA